MLLIKLNPAHLNMKFFTLAFSLLLAISFTAYAQNGVPDNYPTAKIYIVDAQNGQEVLANSDTAILFKNALIDLVTNTIIVQKQYKHVMGHNAYVITQTDPSNGNEYQLQETTKVFGTVVPVYTFIYNVDQNKLYYNDPHGAGGDQNLAAQWISQDNMANLNRCQQLGWFNNLSAPPDNTQQQQTDDTTPVDTTATASTPPPALPTYDQPECPQDGYLWQPGYWAYSIDARQYYWVPGVWVAPPSEGLLWTPAYWSFNGFGYYYHSGYWGTSVGYYGGIYYGYGYGGHGYYGGEWRSGHYHYNTAVVRVSVSIHNTYVNNTVIVNQTTRNSSSFNGRGGVIAKPSPQEVQIERQPRIQQTPDQIRNQRTARNDKNQFASPTNGNKPMNIAAPRAPAKSVTATPNQRPNANPAGNNGNQRGGYNNQNTKPATGNGNTNTTNQNPGTNNTASKPGYNNTKPAANNTNTVNQNPGTATTTPRPTYNNPNGRTGTSNTPNQNSGVSIPKGTGSVTPSSNNGHGGTYQNQPNGSRGGRNPSNNQKQQPKSQPKNDKSDKK